MSFVLSKPSVDELTSVVDILRDWQYEGASMQLHPGDIGWYWRFGAQATAEAIRTWSRDGQILAAGLLDGPDILRMTIAPDARADEALARQIVADIITPQRDVLPVGRVDVEAPTDTLIHGLLADAGWTTGEAWTPLRRDLSEPVQDPGVRIEAVGPEHAHDHVAVVHAAFGSSTFTTERWHTMAAGPAYADARSLVAYDDHGNAVAAATVWSAGPGRPGLIEPMGAHPDHRGQGFGRAVTIAAAAALQEMGSSSAIVATASSNIPGVATYLSAGYVEQPTRHDSTREA